MIEELDQLVIPKIDLNKVQVRLSSVSHGVLRHIKSCQRNGAATELNHDSVSRLLRSGHWALAIDDTLRVLGTNPGLDICNELKHTYLLCFAASHIYGNDFERLMAKHALLTTVKLNSGIWHGLIGEAYFTIMPDGWESEFDDAISYIRWYVKTSKP